MCNDDVKPFLFGKNSMQMGNGLYRRFLEDFGLLKRTSSTYNQSCFIHAKKTSFSTKRRVVKDKENGRINICKCPT